MILHECRYFTQSAICNFVIAGQAQVLSEMPYGITCMLIGIIPYLAMLTWSGSIPKVVLRTVV